jgi:hypothetical protein
VSAGDLKVSIGRNPASSSGFASNQDFREIYWRLYMRTQPGWSGYPGKLSRATSLVTTNWAQSFTAPVWTDGSAVLAIDPKSGTTETGELISTGYNTAGRWLGIDRGQIPVFSTAESDKWFCIETHVKLNTPGSSDGEFDLWIDDQLDAQRTGLNWVGNYQDYGINSIFIENYWNEGAPASRTRYVDNLVISTSRIGCGSGRPFIGKPGTPYVVPGP